MRIFLSSLVVSLVLSGCFGSPVTPVPTAPSDATAPTAVTKEAEKVTDVAPAPTAPTVKNQDAKKPSTQPVKGSSQSAPTTPKPQTSQETTS